MTRTALVTGATGYVGGELVPHLLRAGWRVRVLTRNSSSVDEQPWGGEVEVVEGDAARPQDIARALQGADAAWYLLHSMGEPGEDFAEQEREMATIFAAAASEAGVSRIIYLGGLNPGGELSPHLASRVEVGEILMASGVPTAALQAGVVIGDESASFVMLRHLSERLPGAVGPSWLHNKIQPIAVDDLMHYLVAAADLPSDVNRTFDVGGEEVVSYAGMMKRYARAMGLGPRVVLIAPVTTPRLAARWIGLATPISRALAEPLIESLDHDTVVSERDLDDLVGRPPGGLTSFDDAVRSAARGTDPWRFLRTLAGCTAAVAACAVAGSIGTTPRSAWYSSLRKPAWQPPGAVFPIAWTTLCALIAAGSALTLADLEESGRADEARSFRRALGINLVLNATWSWIFFRFHKLPAATVTAAALAASSGDLARRAGKLGPEKRLMFLPYAAWTTFATALTAAVTRLNRPRVD